MPDKLPGEWKEFCEAHEIPGTGGPDPQPPGLGPHEDELIFKTQGRAPASRAGSAPKQIFIHQCKHCMRIRAEFPDL